jgi:hypothetical protein
VGSGHRGRGGLHLRWRLVSRLYDRALANGCRPLSFWDLVNGYFLRAPVEGRDPDLSAKMALRELGREETPEEIAKVHEHLRRTTSQYVRSSTAFRHSDLATSTVLVANDVGHYFDSFPEGTHMGDLLASVAPPLRDMWIEFDRVPNRLNLRAWGVHLLVVAGPGAEDPTVPDWVPDSARWVVAFSILGEWTKGEIVGPLGHGAICLDADGALMRGELVGRRVVQFQLGGDEVLEQRMQPEHVEFYRSRVQELLYAALLAVSFCHCKNVDQIEVVPGDKLARAYQRRHGHPLTRYWVLDIEPMKRVLARDGEAQQRGLRHALHICRGHFKTYTAEGPLFGRVTGTYWWADQVRGIADVGVVEKDYRIRIDHGTLGRPYEPGDEHLELTTAAENRGSDPDLAGRGLGAHNRTQNLLAEAVEQAGFKPRRPKPDEPQYDLAWETPDAVWVAEVKSLTARNELRQMHTAIGQVIDYGHRLDAGDRTVRLLIAVERVPQSAHWLDECANHEIVLAWPGTFQLLVA